LTTEALVLNGVRAQHVEDSRPTWDAGQWVGALFTAEAGVLAGGALGFAYLFLHFDGPHDFGPVIVGLTIAAIAAPVLGALGSHLFAYYSDTPGNYLAALMGGSVGFFLALLLVV
jgi:hypothetical protein